jgi:hypothetical protein
MKPHLRIYREDEEHLRMLLRRLADEQEHKMISILDRIVERCKKEKEEA